MTTQAVSQKSLNSLIRANSYAAGGLGAGIIMRNGTLVASVGSSALTIAIKTLAGNDPSPADPVLVAIRNTTVATGDYTILSLTAATSVVVSSGSTLGTANSTAFRVWVVGFNDAGTFRLGVVNCLSGTTVYPLGGFAIASSTAEGGAGAADSAQVIYTGTAVSSKPYAILGYVTYESGLGTAGTWSAVPTRLDLFRPGMPTPGQVVQVQETFTTAGPTTGTTTIPADNTIPQSTEGDQYLSQAITPTSAANVLEVDAELHLTNSGGNTVIVAMFRDAVANALAALSATCASAGATVVPMIRTVALAGSTSATTFKVRAGSNTASTTTFNGFNGGTQAFGGVCASFIRARELMA